MSSMRNSMFYANPNNSYNGVLYNQQSINPNLFTIGNVRSKYLDSQDKGSLFGSYEFGKGLGEGLASKGMKTANTNVNANTSNVPLAGVTDALNQAKLSGLSELGLKPQGIKTNPNPTTKLGGEGTNWGGIMDNVGKGIGMAGQVANIVFGINDMIQSRKMFKENKKTMELQREALREQLEMNRKEYARLNRNRAAVTAAYGA